MYGAQVTTWNTAGWPGQFRPRRVAHYALRHRTQLQTPGQQPADDNIRVSTPEFAPAVESYGSNFGKTALRLSLGTALAAVLLLPHPTDQNVNTPVSTGGGKQRAVVPDLSDIAAPTVLPAPAVPVAQTVRPSKPQLARNRAPVNSGAPLPGASDKPPPASSAGSNDVPAPASSTAAVNLTGPIGEIPTERASEIANPAAALASGSELSLNEFALPRDDVVIVLRDLPAPVTAVPEEPREQLLARESALPIEGEKIILPDIPLPVVNVPVAPPVQSLASESTLPKEGEEIVLRDIPVPEITTPVASPPQSVARESAPRRLSPEPQPVPRAAPATTAERQVGPPPRRRVDIDQIPGTMSRLAEVELGNAPSVALAPQVTTRHSEVAQVDVPQLTKSRLALARTEMPGRVSLRIGTTDLGPVAVRISRDRKMEVDLGDLISRVGDRLPAGDYERFSASRAARTFVDIDKLASAGLSLNYNAAYDELRLSLK